MTQAQRDHKAFRVLREPKDLRVPANPAIKVRWARRVTLDQRVRLVLPVHRGFKVFPAPMVLLVLRELRVRRVLRVPRVILVMRVRQELTAHKARPVLRDLRAFKVLRALPVLRDPKVFKVLRELKDPRVRLVRQQQRNGSGISRWPDGWLTLISPMAIPELRLIQQPSSSSRQTVFRPWIRASTS